MKGLRLSLMVLLALLWALALPLSAEGDGGTNTVEELEKAQKRIVELAKEGAALKQELGELRKKCRELEKRLADLSPADQPPADPQPAGDPPSEDPVSNDSVKKKAKERVYGSAKEIVEQIPAQYFVSDPEVITEYKDDKEIKKRVRFFNGLQSAAIFDWFRDNINDKPFCIELKFDAKGIYHFKPFSFRDVAFHGGYALVFQSEDRNYLATIKEGTPIKVSGKVQITDCLRRNDDGTLLIVRVYDCKVVR